MISQHSRRGDRSGERPSRADRDRHRVSEECGQIIELRAETQHRVHVGCQERAGHGETTKHRAIITGTVLDASRRKAITEIIWSER